MSKKKMPRIDPHEYRNGDGPMNDKIEPPLFSINKIQLTLGLAALCFGALVYLTVRAPDRIYFTKFFGVHDPILKIQSGILKSIGNSLPSFVHVFSFSLITASFFSNRKRTYAVICMGWLFIDCCFELGQKYKIQASRWAFDFLDAIPFLESTRNFFLLGTFDGFDLMAFGLGAAAAFWVLLATAEGT